MQGQFELNVRDPADRAQPAAVDPPADDRLARCSPRSASTASRPTSRAASARPSRTLAVATALNPYIGYDKARRDRQGRVGRAARTLREVAREHGVDEETLDKALDLRKIAAGSGQAHVAAPWARTPACSRRSSATATRCRARAPTRSTSGRSRSSSARVPWRYYARPRLGLRPRGHRRGRGGGARAPARRGGARDASSGSPRSTPSLAGAAEATGLTVTSVPLMALEAGRLGAGAAARRRAGAPAGGRRPGARRAARAVELAFVQPHGGPSRLAGPAERDALAARSGDVGFLRDRLERRLTVMAAADDDGGPLAAGSAPAGRRGDRDHRRRDAAARPPAGAWPPR